MQQGSRLFKKNFNNTFKEWRDDIVPTKQGPFTIKTESSEHEKGHLGIQNI